MSAITVLLILFIQLTKISNTVPTEECELVEYSAPLHHSFPARINPQYICINGIRGLSIWAIWSDVELTAKAESKHNIKFINGKSCEDVAKKYANQSSSWFSYIPSFSPSNSGGRKSVIVSPYGHNCFAVYIDGVSGSNFVIEVAVHKLRLLYPIMMVAGMLIFYNANEISRSVLFYYTSGVSIGMILSVLLLVFIISRIIPQRSISYAFLFSGSSFVIYLLQLSCNRLSSKALENNKILIGYCMIAGLISFLYCYYRGPVRNERSVDIMRWCLQGLALFLVYYSIRCDQISLTFVLILVASRWVSLQQICLYLVTRRWIPYRLQLLFLKPRLITMDEYEREGREETARALKELREYCESPDCDTWRTVSRLKSPKRFASFMSDAVHLTEDELTQYEDAPFDTAPFLTSDEDSEPELAAMNLDFNE